MDNGETKKISLSVIVPVYNTSKWLRECLDSILAQDAFDLEVICVDDGSTDASPEILSAYAERDPRIRVITQENQGLAVARNTGEDTAEGKYLWFVDSDDTINPETLGAVCRAAEDYHDPQVICFPSFCKFTDEDYQGPRYSGEFLEKPIPRLMGIHTGPEVFRILREEKRPWYCVWRNMFRKDFLIEHQLYALPELYRNQDTEFMLRIYREADSVACIPETVVNYRIREGSNTDLLKRGGTPRDIKLKIDFITALYKTYSGSETLFQADPTFNKWIMKNIRDPQMFYRDMKNEITKNEIDSYFEDERTEKILLDLMVRYPVETGKDLVTLAEAKKKLKSGCQGIHSLLLASAGKRIRALLKRR